MRRRRPGVTAAPTTAAFAIGAGPGRTAAVTTAALATGARMTPTRPMRAGLSGMSVSCVLGSRIGLDGGDDRLDGDSPVGDQLTAGAPGCRGEWRGPQVLVDEDSGNAARIHGRGEVSDVIRGEKFGEVGLDANQITQIPGIGEFHRVD